MSELALGQIKGLTVNSNVVTVPSGHTLYAPGHVIQVVTNTYSTPTSVAGTTPASTGLTVSISPKSATSMILVQYSVNGLEKQGDTNTSGTITLYKNGSFVQEAADFAGYSMPAVTNMPGVSNHYSSIAGSLSAQTYTVMFYRSLGTGAFYVQNNGTTSSITVLEIAA